MILHGKSGTHGGRGDELPYFHASHLCPRASEGQVGAQALQLSAEPLEHAGKLVTIARGKFSKESRLCGQKEEHTETSGEHTDMVKRCETICTEYEGRSALLEKRLFKEMALHLY